MKILFVSPNPLIRELGAPKVLIELSEAMRELDCDCQLIQPCDLGVASGPGQSFRDAFAAALRDYLKKRAGEFDVVDYDHETLPFPRAQFQRNTLMVARSVLLVQHLATLAIPQPRGMRAIVTRLIKGRARRRELEHRIAVADETVRQADLVNVSNAEDRAALIARGVSGQKIIIQPFGLSAARFAQFDRIASAATPAKPVVAFVGTFDYRKGASDFPKLASHITSEITEATFRLLGTAGLFPTAEQVLRFFPPELRSRITVMPKFDHDRLPDLLRDCSIGVFPSYCEGFGFGVLEMLAAGLPVVAYDAPGPPMMLGPEALVSPGDVRAMSDKVVGLLRNPTALLAARADARKSAGRFHWQQIARETLQCYSEAQARKIAR